jgi:Carboxypeptidase regulatory-like domain
MQLQLRSLSTPSFRSHLRALFSSLFGLIFLCTMLAVPAHAQEFRGTISGAVSDPTGAVIPGANVVVRETHTGTINKTTSDAAGQFVVPFLLPGDYAIKVTANGFQTIEDTITLQAQEHPILNLKLTVGNAGTTVTVNAAPPILDQANASVGQVISTESVADLPLNGRTPAVLQELSVGVVSEIPPQLVHPFDNSAGNSWSLGGTPNQSSEVLLDGSPDLTILGQLAFSPSEDTTQEVSIRPFDTDASFGHTIGGVVNQITKSGTNRLHGTIYEFNQIPNLDANTYFDDRAVPVVPLPVTHFNQYGLTVGGPIIIPKVYDGKNKLFFFFAFEGLKDSQPVTTTTTVPTTSGGLTGSGETAGDFYQTLAAGCPGGFANDPATAAATCLPSGTHTTNYADPNQIYNPYAVTVNGSSYSRAPILDNQLTSVSGFSVNPVAAAYFKLYPQANNSANASADGLDNYISNAPSADTFNSEFGRMDYNLSSRDHVFFDFRHNNRTQTKSDFFNNNSFGSQLLRENFGSTIDNVFTLNSSTIFDARFNWTYFDEAHLALSQAYSANTVGLPAALTTSSEKPQLPCVLFGTASSVGTCTTATTSYQDLGDNSNSSLDPTTSYQAFVDMVKVLGRHTLKIGFDGRRYQLRDTSYGNSSGSFNFGENFVTSGTGASTSTLFGGDLASFEFGLPNAGQYDLNAEGDYRGYYVGTFVQDDWRVNNELTLNVGLRFDIDTPFGEKFGRTVNGFDPTATNTVSGTQLAAPVTETLNGDTFTVNSINAAGGLTFPSANRGAPYQTNSGFLSPRFGFSYSPAVLNNKTVIRGGFGIFVEPETISQLSTAGVVSSSEINNQEGFSQTTQYVATNNSFQTPANTLSNPFPNGFLKPTGAAGGASTFLGQAISFLAPVEHDPYSERWNLGVQQSLTSSTLFEVLFVGNHGVHLPVLSQNLNAPELQFLTTNPYRDQNLATEYAKSVPNPFAGLLPNSSGCNGATTTFSNLILPYPQFCNAAVTEENQTIGQSYFNSVILHMEQRAKHGLTLTANYSFNKLIEADIFLNPEDTKVTREISPEDHTHHFTVGGTYELPFGKGKMYSFGGNRLMNEILGGFVVNGVYQFQTGAPLVFSADIPLAPGATLRDITNQPRNTNPAVAGQKPGLNVAAFVTGSVSSCTGPAGCDGTVFLDGQYADHYRTLPQTLSWVRADGYNNLDASILKNFNLPGSAYLQLRFETFNTLNHPVFAPANTSSATASNFGFNTTGTIANSLPRQVQLGGRIVF